MSAELAESLQALGKTRTAIADTATPAFDSRLVELRDWQAARIERLHRPTAERFAARDLLGFLTRRFYQQADWTELLARPERIAARTQRIITDDRPLVIAVRLQESADRLDARMATTLNEHAGTAAITPLRYARAFGTVGEPTLRARQIRWVEELVDRLAGFAHNRTAYWAFKLAGGPARALGLARTYALLADGFAAMRTVDDLPGATSEALAVQRAVLARLQPEAE
ncbi:hypothetical protein [Salinisphaera sp. T31B1]|uniref:FFLEELY motif protein n=1 Tax=Salinisphaera sp. T31B1 TaxID=727963 RepID=UPI00333FAFA4